MSRAERVALALIATLVFARSALLRVDYDEDIDALRFRLAVERFDVASLRPHTPYYPVYVALAKLVALLGASPRAALGLVGALAAAGVVVATSLLARELLGRRAGVVAALLAAASPFLSLLAGKLLSDAAGVAIFTLALWLVARARRAAREGSSPSELRTAAIVLLGVALGVRLSYFPIALACAAVIAIDEGGGRAWIARARDLAAGVALWLLPLVLIGGPRALVRTTWIQGAGHFTRWGGSVITVPSPIDRAYGVAWGLWANVLGGAWIDAPAIRWIAAPITITLLVVAAGRLDRARAWARENPEIAASAAAYVAWAALGQNIANKPRHWAPLAPLLIVAMSAGAARLIDRGRAYGALAGALSLAWLVDGYALLRAHVAPSPAAAIVAFLRDGGEAGRVVITCDLARMIAEGAKGRPTIDAASEAELLRAIEASSDGARVTSECLTRAATSALEARGFVVREVFSRPRSRYVDSLWPRLALVDVRRAVTP